MALRHARGFVSYNHPTRHHFSRKYVFFIHFETPQFCIWAIWTVHSAQLCELVIDTSWEFVRVVLLIVT
jgi:hypothetical protein